MGFINNVISQFTETFSALPGGRKILLLLIMVGSIGGLTWLMVRASTGGYVPVLTDADVGETAQALAKLSQLQIPAKTSDNGTTLLVSANKQDEAAMALAMEGIYDRGATVGNELLDRNSFGDSQFKQEKNYLRVREGEMARTLMTLSEVENARVHFAIPEDQLFVQDTQQPKASVVLQIRPGSRLTERQITGVVNLVSHSVEGLQPDAVTILDQNGNQLNQHSPSEFAHLTSENLNFKSQAEERLKHQIEVMLGRTVGADKVVASVQMDFDFAQQKRVDTIFNPNDQDPILQMEKSVIEQQTSPGNATPDTAAANAGATASSSGARTALPGTTRDESTKNYSVSQSVQETAQTVPTLKRMTVGVMVDGQYDEVKAADGTVTKEFRQRTPEEMAELEKVVKAIIGFNTDTRNDVVEVTCVPFQTDAPDLGPKPWMTPQIQQMVQMGVQWGVVGLIGLLLILMVLKPAVSQMTVTPGTARALPGGGGKGRLGLPAGEDGADEEGEGMEGYIEGAPGSNQRLLQLQQNNKIASLGSEQIHREIQTEAKSNPERTVSMIRQWMEEG